MGVSEYDPEAEAYLAARTAIMASGGSFMTPIEQIPYELEQINLRAAAGMTAGQDVPIQIQPTTTTPQPWYMPEPLPSGEYDIVQAGFPPWLLPAAIAGLAGYFGGGALEGITAAGETALATMPAAGVTTTPTTYGAGVTTSTTTSPVPLGGPFLAEPDPKYIVWQKRLEKAGGGTYNMYRLAVPDGRGRVQTWMATWSSTTGWKFWKPAKHIVISKNPRVKNLTMLAKLNKRVEKMLKPFQPKPKKTRYGQLPAKFLSTIEKAALKAAG